jgi:hypothetical protein
VRRSPFAVAVVATFVAVGLTACDDGGSGKDSKPRRSSTSTRSSTTTTSSTVPGGNTGSTTTLPSGSTTTIPLALGTCGNQTEAITAAIGFGVQGLDSRAGQYTIQKCRIAASSPIWAAAEIVPNPGVQLDPATVVLQRIGALWNVESTGTSNAGCNAPAMVKTDLGLICPG